MKRLLHGLAALVALAAILLAGLFYAADSETTALDESARASAPGDFVALSDGVTHYELGGPADGQTVVLIHGFSVPYYIWDTTYEALTAAGFRVLRYDIFGRGYSDRPDVAYDGALFERQVVELVEQLELQTPIDVIGLSMGGAIAMRVAARNPQSVRRIALVDPLHEGYEPPPLPRPLGDYVLTLRLVPNLAEGQLTDFLHPENYPTWVEQYRVQMQYEGFRRAIISTVYEYMTEDHFSHFKTVGEMDKPVQLIWGKQDRTLDIAGADDIKSVVDVEFLAVDQSGHLPHIEQGAIVNSAIRDFLTTD